ncbi:MAG: L-lactate dehydrogenase [Oceanicaulis sp.]
MARTLARTVSFEDFRAAAKARLPRLLFDYIDGGSYAETTIRNNAAAFEAATLEPRLMVDVSAPDSRVSVCGQDLPSPLILAPVGFAGMYARRGEVQAARAAAKAGVPFTLSTVSICSIEEVTKGAGAAPWFQLYMIKDRGYVAELLGRARAAGCPVLVLTADLQTPGARYRDVRSGMTRKPGLADWIARGAEGAGKLGWVRDVYLSGRPHAFGNLEGVLPKAADFHDAWAWIAANFDPSLSWADLDFIRSNWDGPIVLKGVMNVEDARLAARHGLDAIVVSNHGGRQLDGARATLEVLPRIAEAVGGELDVLVDGGVRSGLDILKAVEHGADAVMAGKAWAYALAGFGEAGVSRLLDIWAGELKTAQALSARLTLRRDARAATKRPKPDPAR